MIALSHISLALSAPDLRGMRGLGPRRASPIVSRGRGRIISLVSKEPVIEVRCEQCQTSFAPETRRCVHCGAPLSKRRWVPEVAEGFDPDRSPEEEELLTKGPKRAIWVVAALVTAVASMLRTCVE